MLTKYGSILTIANAQSFKKEFPDFVQNNLKAMQRLAAIDPIMLDPERFLYMRTRLVSAVEKHGPNANGDAFEHQELAARHPTFIRSAVNIDHENDDPKKAVGFILDAIYKPGIADMYAEGIHAIDKKLAEARRKGIIADIEEGRITDTSMGCFVEASVCSECLKKEGWDGQWDVNNPDRVNQFVAKLKPGKGIASVPEEYCTHIGKFGEKKGGMGGPYEINRNVTFFEDSIITTAGADKDAKYLEKIAQLGKSDWSKYLIHRVLVNGAVVEANQKLKGVDEMKTELEKKAESELNKDDAVAREDKGDVGDGHAKYEEQLKESKGKSDAKDDASKGNLLTSMEGKGDYALAAKKDLEAIARVKQLAKQNPKEVQALLFETAEGVGEIEEDICKTCGKPQSGCICESDPSQKMPEIKKEEAVKQVKAKSLVDRIVDKVTAALLGNQVETMEDKGDYGDGHKKYDEQAVEAKGKSDSKDDDSRGNQNMTMEGKGDLPLTAAKKKEAEEHTNLDTLKSEGEAPADKSQEDGAMSKEKMASIVEKLQKGAKYDEATEKTADNKSKESREARRKRILADTEDLNRGSMGSGGTERDGGAEDLKDFHEKVEEPISKKLEEVEEKTVGAKKKVAADGHDPKAEAEVAKGNEETIDQKQIKEDNGRKVGSKKIADEHMEHDDLHEIEVGDGGAPASSKMEHDDEHPIEDHIPSPEEVEMEHSDGPGAKKWDPMFDKGAGKDPIEHAKDMVDGMDEKEAGLRTLISAKKERAQVMAKGGYKTAAMHHIAGIQVLEKHADRLLGFADKIAKLIEGSEKLDNEKKEAVIASINNLLKLAGEEMKSTKKDLDGMKDEDMKKEETYKAAKRVINAENETKMYKAQAATAVEKVASVVKSRVIAETIKLGSQKGVVTAANRAQHIEKLSSMTDVQFEATRTAWRELPDVVANRQDEGGYVQSIVREGAKKPESLGKLSPKEASDQSVDSLDDPDFFN